MYGHLVLEDRRRGSRAALDRETLCGLPVLRAAVPAPDGLGKRRLERRVFRAAARLWAAGVSRVLTPEDFPWPEALTRAGLAPVETGGLVRTAAASLTLAALEGRGWEPGRAVVALAASEVSIPLVRAAETLAGKVCRIVVEVEPGGERLAGYLHEEYGLPVLPPGVVRPALTVALDESWQGSGPALRLYGPRPDLLGTELWSPGLTMPEDCARLPLLAALWESGLLSGGSLMARPAKAT